MAVAEVWDIGKEERGDRPVITTRENLAKM